MNLVLRRLQEHGLLTRPSQAPHGRALPSMITPAGQTLLTQASAVVRAAEKRMFAPLSPEQQRRLREDLAACLAAAPTSVHPTP